MRSSVLLPQPEGPSRLRNSPRATDQIDPVQRLQPRREALCDAAHDDDGVGIGIRFHGAAAPDQNCPTIPTRPSASSTKPSSSAGRQAFAKEAPRDEIAEIQLDQAERADIGDRLQRHRGEPAGRADRPHRAGQHRHPPRPQYRDDDPALPPATDSRRAGASAMPAPRPANRRRPARSTACRAPARRRDTRPPPARTRPRSRSRAAPRARSSRRAIARSERSSFGSETRITPAVATRIAATESSRDPVAEQDQAEHRDLHQLGLGVGDPEREIALLHAAQQQRGGRDLAQRGDERSTPETAA